MTQRRVCKRRFPSCRFRPSIDSRFVAESLTYSLARWGQNLGEVDQRGARVQKWEIPSAVCGSSRWVKAAQPLNDRRVSTTQDAPVQSSEYEAVQDQEGQAERCNYNGGQADQSDGLEVTIPDRAVFLQQFIDRLLLLGRNR